MSKPSQQLETIKGRLFGVYNAITGYFQNVSSYDDDEAKLKSLLYGSTVQMGAQNTFQLCAEYVNEGVDTLLNQPLRGIFNLPFCLKNCYTLLSLSFFS